MPTTTLIFEVVIGVFMLLFGINFNLYYFLLLRHFREALASEELHVYLGIVAFSTLTITANIAGLYDSVGTALRTAFFQVSSIVTTTGYATVDFNLWPTYSRVVIVILTFVGACAGSTAGGLKVSPRYHLLQGGAAGSEQDAAQPRRHHGPV